jgi:hypothetical protein
MDYLDPLKLLVLASAAVCAAALAWQGLRTWRFGRRPDLSVPAGSAAAGVAYAFGPGMAPWAKESARAHLATWTAGVFYHLAVLFAFTALGFLVAGLLPPPEPLPVIRAVLALGLAAGAGLFVKRLTASSLRTISCPDDLIANLLVTGFLALALAATWAADEPWGAAAAALFMLWGTALLLYIPFGKVRHCFFFFYTRVLFGRWYGRRGVIPGGRG